MNKNSIVTINGKKYDALTGLPIESVTTKTRNTADSPHATGVHSTPMRSQTLVRRTTKKPVPSTKPAHKPGQTMDIARSRSISRFAPHPVTAAKPQAKTVIDKPATHHPLLNRTLHMQAARHVAKPVELTSKEIKDQAIAKALATPSTKPVKKKFIRRHPRLVTVLSFSIVVAVALAYVVYLNMPALSVRLAATQAGINATYPQYQPDGYSLNGPVTFTDGAVSIHFAANTGTTKFDITQAKSSWDSTAVLDNVVRKATGNNYITSQESGLTIYSYDGNAAWVNAGILYTIVGDAPLSGDQIRHIATSL
jgi:hypothetical protein